MIPIYMNLDTNKNVPCKVLTKAGKLNIRLKPEIIQVNKQVYWEAGFLHTEGSTNKEGILQK